MHEIWVLQMGEDDKTYLAVGTGAGVGVATAAVVVVAGVGRHVDSLVRS